MNSFSPESSVVAEVIPSPNHGERKNGMEPDMIVLHYTGMLSADAALARLCSPGDEVSAHYFVFENGHIVQCVPEARRAWHAGTGSWAGEADVNSCSIGIEIANPGHDHGYPDYPLRQIAALITLCRAILMRRKIPPHRVLGHSDIAPARKQDPGEKFPWRLLHDSGVGLWVSPAPIIEDQPFFALGDSDLAIAELQAKLADFGYGITTRNGQYNAETMSFVGAFQRHFRPARVDGMADRSTLQTLDAVLQARGPVYA